MVGGHEGEGREGSGVMKFTIIDCEQRSPEWFAARAGRLTGSRAAAMCAKIKTGEAAARRDLRLQMACERITGIPQENEFVSKEMQRGIDMEPTAFAEYEAATGSIVERTGFLQSNSFMAGCSLDGHISGFAGIIELKVPKSATHLGYIRGGVLPSDHLPQVRHNLWVTGAEWADFASYDDRFPEELRMFIVRAWAKDLDIPGYEADVNRFLAEVAVEVADIQTLRKAA